MHDIFCQGSENNEDLHSTHAMQISQRLEGIVRMWDPSFEYDPGENPFVRQLLNLWFNYLFSLELEDVSWVCSRIPCVQNNGEDLKTSWIWPSRDVAGHDSFLFQGP